MSAFVVGKEHIDAIIRKGLAIRNGMSWYHKECPGGHSRLDELTADKTGQMLIDACVHSVMARYSDCNITNLPGPNNAYWLIPYTYELDFTAVMPTAIQAIVLARCYEHQSCEADDWKDSEAKAFIDAFTSHMITLLPGYDDAPWEWKEKDAHPQSKVVRFKS